MKKAIISQKAAVELEKRINGELAAEYFYKALSNAMQFIGYFGAAKFFLSESKQETEHYQKIVDFLNDVGVLPSLQIVTPTLEKFTDIQSAFEFAFGKERELQIIYSDLLNDFKDEPTIYQFLLWFVEEQTKSVGEYGDFLSRIELCKNEASALLAFDSELNG